MNDLILKNSTGEVFKTSLLMGDMSEPSHVFDCEGHSCRASHQSGCSCIAKRCENFLNVQQPVYGPVTQAIFIPSFALSGKFTI